MVTLIGSTVSVTIRHSESAPIASEAATVWVSRDEATGAERPSKPAPPCDRVMAENPSLRGRITCGIQGLQQAPPAILRRHAVEKWRKDGRGNRYARYSRCPTLFSGSSLGGDTGPVVDLGAGFPVHGHESRRLLDPPQPRADRRECREVIIAAVGDMAVAVERDIGDRELAGGKIFMRLEVIFHH